MLVERRDIWYADLNGGQGSEQNGVRPVLIVSNGMNNIHSSTVTIVPITSRMKKPLVTHVKVNKTNANGLSKDGFILCEHIRTISKDRLQNRIGKLNKILMRQVDNAMMIQLGIGGQ